MPSYAVNKPYIYKWRENNVAHYNEIARKHQVKYRAWIKVKKEFLNILLD